jgi:hypothetical protein
MHPFFFITYAFIHGNKFDMEWAQEAKQTMEMKNNHLLHQFQHKDMFYVAKQVIKEMR